MENTSTALTTTNAAPLATLNEIERTAKSIAASKMFGMQTPDQALVLMLLCQSEGKNPIQAVRQYHIIQGRPAMRADAMQAEFQARGGGIVFHERTDDACDATFTNGATEARVRWTMQDAKKAGLLAKPGPWQQFPRAMLHARCVSEGVRAVMPAVVAGIYTPEEVSQFDSTPEASPVAALPAAPAREPMTRQTPEPKEGDVIEGEIVHEAPAAPAAKQLTPEETLHAEQRRFISGAMVLGLNVLQDDGSLKPDKKKAIALFGAVAKFTKNEFDARVADHWRSAHGVLPAYSEHLRTEQEKRQKTADAEAQALLGNNPSDPNYDPFEENAPSGAAMAGNAIASGL